MKISLIISLLFASQFAAANSYTQKCFFPAGVHFGERDMLSTADSQNSEKTLVDANSGTLGAMPESVKKGDVISFKTQDQKVSVKIQVLKDVKTIGYFSSSAALSEPEKHCAPSSDFTSLQTEVSVTREEQGRKAQTVKATLYCTEHGGYHGYYGQGDCEMPQE